MLVRGMIWYFAEKLPWDFVRVCRYDPVYKKSKMEASIGWLSKVAS